MKNKGMYIRKKCRIAVIVIVILILFFSQKNCIAVENTTNESTNSIENIPSILDVGDEYNPDVNDNYAEDGWKIIIQKIFFREFLFIVTGLGLFILIKILKIEVSKKLKIVVIILEIIATFISTYEIFIPSMTAATIFGKCDFTRIILYGLVIFMMLKIVKNAINTKQNNIEKYVLYFILLLLEIISILAIMMYWSIYTSCGIECFISGIICSIGYAINVILGLITIFQSLMMKNKCTNENLKTKNIVNPLLKIILAVLILAIIYNIIKLIVEINHEFYIDSDSKYIVYMIYEESTSSITGWR